MRSAATFLAACLLVAAAAPVADGAIPPRTQRPQGEPAGLETVVIESETVEIDLRPLAAAAGTTATIPVSARYMLRNDRADRRLRLVFVNLPADLRLTLDGTAVPVDRLKQRERLASHAAWEPPTSTPRLSGGGSLYYSAWQFGPDNDQTFDAIELTLPAGTHELATLASHSLWRLRAGAVWQYAYLLGRGRVYQVEPEMRVLLPTGWRAATNLYSVRKDDTLEVVLVTSNLAHRSLALTAGAPGAVEEVYEYEPSGIPVDAGWVAAAVAAALAGLVFVLARWSRRRQI